MELATNLFPVTHRDPLKRGGVQQWWCGPAALSAITGRSAEACAAWINEDRGLPLHFSTKAVRGTEVKWALRRLGYDWAGGYGTPDTVQRAKLWRITWDERPTLAQWLRARRGAARRCTWLVCTNGKTGNSGSGHFVVVRGNKLVDSHQSEPVFITKARKRRSRVRWAMPIRLLEGSKAVATRRRRHDPLPATPTN